MLLVFIIGVTVGALFNDKIKSTLISCSYNVMYYYSKLEIMYNKYIKVDAMSHMEGKFIYEFVKDNKIYHEPISGYVFSIKCLYDGGVLYKKIIYKNEELVVDGSFLNNFEKSDIQFLLVEFKIGENEWHKVNLKNDSMTYYLVGNKFNRDFFIFYMSNCLGNVHIRENDKCCLKIIDHDFNEFTLDFTDKNEHIILGKNGYNVEITNNHNKD